MQVPHESQAVCLLTEAAKTALVYCIYAPIEKILSFKISKADAELFCRAAEDYILNQLERSFRALEFYKEVKRK